MGYHTTGPWRVIQYALSDEYFIRDYEHRTIACDVQGKANAALIAAAPDLLEALDTLVDDFVVNEDYRRLDHFGELSNKFAKARAAIAKAKGE